MKYATYSTLKKRGSIVIWNEGGLVQEVHKPLNLSEWDGLVIVLDFDDPEPGNDAYTEITLEDRTKRHCYYSVW
jgi:hypothetical protein